MPSRVVIHWSSVKSAMDELARVTRSGGRLVLFHPSGRAALAARHGRPLSPDDPLAQGPLVQATQATGWHLTGYDDAPERYLAVATRAGR